MSGEELRSMMSEREQQFSAELGQLSADDVRQQRVLHGARSRRRRLAWGRGAVAAAAVTVIGLGTWALVGWRGDVEPIATPQPSPTSSPSNSPVEPSDLTFPVPLPADGYFLEAARMTVEVWSHVEDGWVLTYWQPSRQAWGDAGNDVTDPKKAAVYLMSPQGERYELGHFDAQPDVTIAQIVWWEPDTLEAIVDVWEADETRWQWLDLRTGALEAVGGLSADVSLMGWTPDDKIVFQSDKAIVALARDATQTTLLEDAAGALLSPDGTTLVTVQRDESEAATTISAYSTSDGAPAWTFDIDEVQGGVGASCDFEGWAGPASPALVCQDVSGPDDALVAGPATIYGLSGSGASQIFADDSGLQWQNVQVAADGLVALGADAGAQGYGPVYYIDRTPISAWPAPDGHQYVPAIRTAGSVEIASWGSESGYASVTGRDVATGAAFEVTPPLQADPDWWWTTINRTFFVGGTGAVS